MKRERNFAWEIFLCVHMFAQIWEKKFLPRIQGSDGKCGNSEFDPWVWKIPWRRQWTLHSTPLHSTPHSTLLAWRIPRTEEPCGLQSMVSQRVNHDWVANTFTEMSIYINMDKLKLEDLGRIDILFYSFYPICDAKT